MFTRACLQAKEEEYKQLKEKLAPEPQYGPKDSAHPTTTLRFNFPNGSREQRMFEANAPVKQIFYFAAIALYDANIDTELARYDGWPPGMGLCGFNLSCHSPVCWTSH